MAVVVRPVGVFFADSPDERQQSRQYLLAREPRVLSALGAEPVLYRTVGGIVNVALRASVSEPSGCFVQPSYLIELSLIKHVDLPRAFTRWEALKTGSPRYGKVGRDSWVWGV